MVSESQKKAINKWQKENYEFIKLRLNKGEADQIREAAAQSGKSVNSYLRDLILK